MGMADMKALSEAIIKGDQGRAVALTKDALAEGLSATSILNDGLLAGMNVLGKRFKNNEVYIPEVLVAARAMKMAMDVLAPKLAESRSGVIAKVAIGTVQGDLHDIGKKLVSVMLRGAGFEVIDLGVDVSAETFVEQAKSSNAKIVAMSALLTTTMPAMEKVIKALKDAKCDVKTLIGGAPVTQNYADRIGADGYAADAAAAVDVAKALL
jgi:5-methyltetrahydrofolate--homocysteine methyltransferase